jgi:hypothetical protein
MAREPQMPPEMVALLKTLEQLQLDMARKDALLAERDARISELTRKHADLVRFEERRVDAWHPLRGGPALV